jgi:hypothetical protein
MPGQGIGRRSQCPLCVEFQKKAPVFGRQGRRIFLPEIDADPSFVSGGNQEAFRRSVMESQIKRGGTENGGGNERREAEDCHNHKGSFVHARLFRCDALGVQRL